MYNNLTFLSNPVNGAQLLMQLTFWTFSVGSSNEKAYAQLLRADLQDLLFLVLIS